MIRLDGARQAFATAEGEDQVLEGKRAAVTGAGQGIGAATARALATHGARVLVSDLRGDLAETVARAICASGGEALAMPVDVTIADQCRAMVDRIVETWGGLDVLVNNAGVHAALSVPETSEEVWDRAMDVNVKGTFLCCKYAIPVMERQGGGVIINLASGASFVGNKRQAAYGAAKAAVLVLTKCMAADHAASGVRVNCICPGIIDTDLIRTWLHQQEDYDAAYAAAAAAAPLGRLGTPEEVAEVIAFMASDHCSFMTGTPVLLDGGLTLMGTRGT
jgi:meso-butanediol dehydrogenase/(S,S)-butanediol dehydrogenase/diacetyl reductase